MPANELSPSAESAPVPAGRSQVVVGVDGSDASKDALAWAADYARMTGAELCAVMAWQWPASMGMAMPLPPDYDPFGDARTGLQRVITEVLGADPGVPITKVVVEGSPSVALVDQSAHASLLVVGSRGHGGFTGLLMGSTSEHCSRHAACPVVIIRHQTTRAQRVPTEALKNTAAATISTASTS